VPRSPPPRRPRARRGWRAATRRPIPSRRATPTSSRMSPLTTPRLRGCSLAICTVPYRRGFFTPACHLGGAIARSTSLLSMKISGLPSSRKS
jgi:hypothetical protein